MIDFHCHLDLFPRPQAVVSEVEAARIYILSVTTTPKAFSRTARLPTKTSRIRTALGLHPQLAHERHQEVELFCRLISETRYAGEIGLDGGDEFARHIVLQKEVFTRLLRSCSDAGGKFLSFHSRHASGEVLEALQQHPGVVHRSCIGLQVQSVTQNALLRWAPGSRSACRCCAASGRDRCWPGYPESAS